MKITLTIVLSEQDQNRLLQNSIERVLNNAIYVGERAEKAKQVELAERASTLWQDCEDLKPLATKIWDSLRNELMIAKLLEAHGDN